MARRATSNDRRRKCASSSGGLSAERFAIDALLVSGHMPSDLGEVDRLIPGQGRSSAPARCCGVRVDDQTTHESILDHSLARVRPVTPLSRLEHKNDDQRREDDEKGYG